MRQFPPQMNNLLSPPFLIWQAGQHFCIFLLFKVHLWVISFCPRLFNAIGHIHVTVKYQVAVQNIYKNINELSRVVRFFPNEMLKNCMFFSFTILRFRIIYLDQVWPSCQRRTISVISLLLYTRLKWTN